MNEITMQNKAIVARFNRECIEQGNAQSFKELLAGNVVNHAAPAGMPNGAESFTYFLNDVLRKGFPDLKVDIQEQVAENDIVTTRKTITATHTGEIFGIPPTHKKVEINVIDMIRLQNGQYAEHWGQSNFADIITQLSSK